MPTTSTTASTLFNGSDTLLSIPDGNDTLMPPSRSPFICGAAADLPDLQDRAFPLATVRDRHCGRDRTVEASSSRLSQILAHSPFQSTNDRDKRLPDGRIGSAGACMQP